MQRISTLTLALGCLLAGGCDSPCETDNDCAAGEMCSVSECVPRSTGTDGGPDQSDAGPGSPDSGSRDAGTDAGPDVALPEYTWDFVLPSLGGFDQARTLVVDPTGAVILAGPYSGTPSVAGTDYPSRGASDVFVIRLTPEGAVDWIQTFGSTGADSCRGVATDADGNIYLTGQYEGSDVSVAGGPAFPHGGVSDGKNIFVASLDSTGAHRWSAGYVGGGTDAGNSVAVSGDHVFVAGFFTNDAVLPDGTVNSVGNRDIMLLDFDRLGALRWQRVYGGEEDDAAWDIAATDNDKVYATGYFGGTVTFGDQGEHTALTAETEALFVLKVNQDGAETQFVSFGAPDGGATGRSIAVTEGRGVLVGGLFNGALALPGFTLTSEGGDGILLRLDFELAYRWGQAIGGAGAGRVLGVAYGAGQQGFAIGQFSGALSVAGESVTAMGEQDVFVIAVDDGDGTPMWLRTWGSPAGDWGWGADVSGDQLVVGGALRGDADFGGGPRSLTGGEAFVASYRVR